MSQGSSLFPTLWKSVFPPLHFLFLCLFNTKQSSPKALEIDLQPFPSLGGITSSLAFKKASYDLLTYELLAFWVFSGGLCFMLDVLKRWDHEGGDLFHTTVFQVVI